MFKLKPVWVGLTVAFILFGTPSAPGANVLPTVGGDAHAYTCTLEFMDRLIALDFYLRDFSPDSHQVYWMRFAYYSCAMTSEG